MSVNALYLSNLPHGITKSQLLHQLGQHPELVDFFKTPYENGTLDVRVYAAQKPEVNRVFDTKKKPKMARVDNRKKKVAVVSGIDCDYDKLLLAFRRVGLWSNATKGELRDKIVIKPDTGEPRDEYGRFLSDRPSHFRVELDKSRGVTNRKTMDVFKPELLDSLHDVLFSGYRSAAYLHSETYAEITEEVLSQAGYLGLFQTHYVNGQPRGKMVTYISQWELLQSYTMFNHNATIARAPPFFTDNEGEEVVDCNYQRGLGVDGQPIDVAYFMRELKYIPFETIHPDFKSNRNIQRIDAICIKCHSRFRLIGVHWKNDYLAGICSCQYDKKLLINDKSRAFFWTGDNFTRLVPTVAFQKRRWNINGPIHYDVLMEPSKREYNDSSQYQSIMSPLLFQEHMFTIKGLAQYKAEATVKTSEFIEKVIWISKACPQQVQQDKGKKPKKPENRYSLILQLPHSPAWAPNNPKAVSKVEIQPKAKSAQETVDPITAVVCKMESSYNSSKIEEILVYCQVEAMEFYWKEHLANESKLKLTPIPCSNEYDVTQTLLTGWATATTSSYKGRNLIEILMLGKSLDKEDWKVIPASIKNKEKWIKSANKNVFRDLLNLQQKQSLDTAVDCRFSVIQGLPGTGKTFNAAMIVLHLQSKEEGHILIFAPSNQACNQFGVTIANITKSLGLEAPRILRILAHGKDTKGYEKIGMSVLKTELETNNTKWLNRGEIRKIEESKQLQYQDLSNLIKHAKENRLDLLTARQLYVLDQHRRAVEEEIMDSFPFIISTVGCLCDNRIKNWASNEKKIPAVVIDEAAQLQHPATLLLGGFNATRTIMAGDQLQLKPAVHSMPAQLGLLDSSLMEAVSFQALVVKGKNHVPWTTLSSKQYRMHFSIYELVCKVTYTGFVPVTKQFYREACKKPLVQDWMKYLLAEYHKKRIIVFNHRGHDQQVGNSYRNWAEVGVIIKRVGEFLDNGIQPCQISIITMYDTQKEAILEALQINEIYGVEVSNVDAVQGSENDVVILSLVRCNKDSDIGFLSKVNRLNVAISRAKEFLVIPCNLEFFKKVDLKHIKTFIDLVVGDPCTPSENIGIVV